MSTKTSRAEARKALPHGLPRLPKLNHKGIQVCGQGVPSFPEEFNTKLQELDKDLWIVWHHPPTWPASRCGVWKIEMCIRHFAGDWPNGKPKHDHSCQRIYVMMVQDDEGTPLPLGDHVLEKLRAMRANSERLGGETPRGLANFIRESNNIDHELANKRAIADEDRMQHNRRYNRRQLSKAYDLLQRHDTARPNR